MQPCDIALDSQDGGKISLCVDLRNKRKNYSIQVYKTMQCIHAWIGPFDIVLYYMHIAAYCCGISVPASVLFYITFHLLSNRGYYFLDIHVI